jgi:hypothetical protein
MDVAKRWKAGEIEFDAWQQEEFIHILTHCAAVRALSAIRLPMMESEALAEKGDLAGANQLARQAQAAAKDSASLLDEVEAIVGPARGWPGKMRSASNWVSEESERIDNLVKKNAGALEKSERLSREERQRLTDDPGDD